MAGLLSGTTSVSQSTARELSTAFLRVLPRLKGELNDQQQAKFVSYYLEMFQLFPDEVNDKWIPPLFAQGDESLRHHFARAITNALRNWNLQSRRQAWECWIQQYWSERAQYNIPPPNVDAKEAQESLSWLQYLSFVFPDAVDLLCRCLSGSPERVYGTNAAGKIPQRVPGTPSDPTVSGCHSKALGGDRPPFGIGSRLANRRTAPSWTSSFRQIASLTIYMEQLKELAIQMGLTRQI